MRKGLADSNVVDDEEEPVYWDFDTGLNLDYDSYIASMAEKRHTHNPDGYNVRTRGAMEVKAPSNIFAATASLPLIHAPGHFSSLSCGSMQVLFGLVTSALLTAAAQCICVYYVWGIAYDSDGTICTSDRQDQALRITCLASFVATVGEELQETINFYIWIGRLPTWHGNDQSERRALAKIRCCLGVRRQRLWVNGVEVEVSSFSRGGIGWCHRFLMYLVCAFKAAIEILLLVGGSGFVLSATTASELLLNSVALAFITQLDDVAYRYFCPDYVKRTPLPTIGLVRGRITAPAGMQERHGMGCCLEFWYTAQPTSLLLLFFGTTMYLYSWWCGV